MENKEKTPRNDRGQLHGYVEIYDYKTNELSVRGYSYNGDDVGYNEYHQSRNRNGQIIYIEFHSAEFINVTYFIR